MATSKNFIDNRLAVAGITDHAGEQQVVCKGDACGKTFWMKTSEIMLATQVNRAILCPRCKFAAIKAAFEPFLEGPD